MNNPSGISFQTQLRVDWSDIDAFNHVNNVAYFRYIQAARVGLCASIGIETNASNPGTGFMVAKTSCSFSKAVDFPEIIKISTQVNKIGNTSFELRHMVSNSIGENVAEAHDVLVLYDFSNNTKVELKDELKAQLSKFVCLA